MLISRARGKAIASGNFMNDTASLDSRGWRRYRTVSDKPVRRDAAAALRSGFFASPGRNTDRQQMCSTSGFAKLKLAVTLFRRLACPLRSSIQAFGAGTGTDNKKEKP
jgi:hypothetical protein